MSGTERATRAVVAGYEVGNALLTTATLAAILYLTLRQAGIDPVREAKMRIRRTRARQREERTTRELTRLRDAIRAGKVTEAA